MLIPRWAQSKAADVFAESIPLPATPFVALPNSFLPFVLGDKLSKYSIGPLRVKLPVAVAPVATTNVFKYSENDL